MGYRSEVSLLTNQKGWAKIEEAVKAVGDSGEKMLQCHLKQLNNGYILAEWHDFKWYDEDPGGFPEVCAAMETINGLADEGIPFEFVRIGEDYTDNVWQEGNVYPADMPHLHLHREIVLD